MGYVLALFTVKSRWGLLATRPSTLWMRLTHMIYLPLVLATL